HPRNSKRSIGVVPQEIIFDPFFTPRETLEIQAGLYGIAQSDRQSDALLAAMHLTDKADAYSRTLSGGMKRRLLVAKAMVHSPPILVLDEPTAGVDVELRRQLWDYVRKLHTQGVTIVLTTHYLEEAEELCDRIAIINHGKVIANEPTRELVSKAQEKAVVVTFDRDISTVPVDDSFQNVSLIDERTLEITYRKDRTNAGRVLASLTADGLGSIGSGMKWLHAAIALLFAGFTDAASASMARPPLDAFLAFANPRRCEQAPAHSKFLAAMVIGKGNFRLR